MYIAIDFDGTIVEDKFPYIGKPVPLALECIKYLNKKGHEIILYTVRVGGYLDEAVEYLKKNNIVLYGINENPDTPYINGPHKVVAYIYIDDHAFGCPLIEYPQLDGYVVNWYSIFVKSDLFGNDFEEII